MKYLGSMKVSSTDGWLDCALDSKKETSEQLKELEDRLIIALSGYDNLIESHQNDLPPSDFEDSKDLLVDFYEKPPSILNKEIKKRRNEHGLSDCPYCGNPVIPDTIDHFIPKSKWPEYSIYENNLVPQCRGCAPTKGEGYFCLEKGTSKFIHPIYSNLLSLIKFKIYVDFNEVSKEVKFTVKLIKVSDSDENEQKRIVFHLRALKVKKRIIQYCDREYRSWKSKITVRKFDIRVALNQRLNEKEQNEIGKDWKTALYKGILDNDKLVCHLNTLGEKAVNVEPIDGEEFVF